MNTNTLKTSMAACGILAIFAGLALAQEQSGTTAKAQPNVRYAVTDLGNVGPDGQPFQVTNNGLVAGAAMVGNALHGVLWYKGHMLDLSTPGLKGQNSQAFGVNVWGQAVGEAETSNSDPNEDFCGFAALGLPSPGGSCVPFLWQNGVMNPLPTLGGNNGAANTINNLGEVVGTAENNMPDGTCPSGGPQEYQFKPVAWRNRAVQELPTYPGDPDGFALGINEVGQVAGTSGDCAAFNPITQDYLQPLHALLWEDQKITDLGTLGGTGQGFGILAYNLNNRGQVIGWSDLAGNAKFHAFLWTRETGMQDLGTVGSDPNSIAIGINDAGQIVGSSIDAKFNPRAFLRVGQDLIDLNELVPTDSPLYLFTACSINASGEIIGIGIDKSTGDVHAYLAVPDHSGQAVESMPIVTPTSGSESPRKLQFQRFLNWRPMKN
jgi:probable HAF family extracellular repeat protein